MKRILLATIALLAVTAGLANAQVQPPSQPVPVSASGTITTTGGNVTILTLQGQNACTVDIGSTAWTGSLTVQASTNWDTIPVSSYGSTSTSTSITANGLYLATTTSLSQIRIIGPTSTGTATVYVFCTQVGQQANISANVTAQTSPIPLPISTPAAGVPLAVSIAQPIAVSTPAAGVPLAVTTPAPAPTNLAGQVVVAVASAVPVTVNTPAPAPTVSPGLLPGTVQVCPSAEPVGYPVSGAYMTTCDSSGNRNVRIGSVASPIPIVASSAVPVTTAVVPSFSSQSNLTNVTNIKGTAGTLYTVSCFNTQPSTVAFIQIFNTAAAGVTLGTTPPVLQQMLAASDTRPFYIPPTTGVAFGTAISIAATTAANGGTVSGSGVYCYETFL